MLQSRNLMRSTALEQFANVCQFIYIASMYFLESSDKNQTLMFCLRIAVYRVHEFVSHRPKRVHTRVLRSTQILVRQRCRSRSTICCCRNAEHEESRVVSWDASLLSIFHCFAVREHTVLDIILTCMHAFNLFNPQKLSFNNFVLY